MQDLGIIDFFFARDEQAIKETDAKYGKLCHRVAYNVLHSNEDAEECVNDAYMGVWNAIPPTRPTNLKAFVCKITRNLSLKRLESMSRQKRSHTMTVPLDELAAVLADESVASDTSDEEIGALISRFLREEREAVRNVFIRRYFFFDPIDDIASRYSFSPSKVKTMLHRTRAKLKAYLIKEGVAL